MTWQKKQDPLLFSEDSRSVGQNILTKAFKRMVTQHLISVTALQFTVVPKHVVWTPRFFLTKHLGEQLQTCSACACESQQHCLFFRVSARSDWNLWTWLVCYSEEKQKMNSQQLRLSRAVDLPWTTKKTRAKSWNKNSGEVKLCLIGLMVAGEWPSRRKTWIRLGCRCICVLNAFCTSRIKISSGILVTAKKQPHTFLSQIGLNGHVCFTCQSLWKLVTLHLDLCRVHDCALCQKFFSLLLGILSVFTQCSTQTFASLHCVLNWGFCQSFHKFSREKT